MKRFAIFLFPCLMDVILGGLLFVNANRIADAGHSAQAVTLVLVFWALPYVLASLAVGRWVTSGNAAALLISGSLGFVGLSAWLAGVEGAGPIYALTAGTALAAALFFVSFQVFMKAVEGDRSRGIARSAALYTFSWSLGMATGPFVSGLIYDGLGWRWCYALYGVLGLATAGGVWLLRRLAQPPAASEDLPEASADPLPPHVAAAGEYRGWPDLAPLAWVGAGVGIFAAHMIRALFPDTAGVYGLSKSEQGTVLGILCWMQAGVGLSFLRSRHWMYRVLPVGFFGVVGVAGLVLFGLSREAAGFYLAAGLYGAYAGSFFFYLVFHALVHPVRSSLYVAVNEMVVGATAVLGALFGGWIADHFGPDRPYLLAAMMVAGAVGLKIFVHRRHAATVRRGIRGELGGPAG
jgi:MFS family permease